MTFDPDKLSNELEKIKKDVVSLKTEPTSLVGSQNGKLPFDVISLDYWNGAPYATVVLSGRHEIIGMKENKSGWQVVSIDMEAREVTFKGQNEEFITVKA